MAWILIGLLLLEVGATGVSATPIQDVKMGTINANETWRGKILLLGDVEIPPGITVSVEPGTQIVVYPLDLTESGQSPRNPEIIIQGNLQLESKKDYPIEFMPLDEFPVKPLKLFNSSTRLIQFQPYHVDLVPLRQDFHKFQSQYFVFWTIIWGIQWLFR